MLITSIALQAPRLTTRVSTGLSSLEAWLSPYTIVRVVPVVATNRVPPSWTSVAVRLRLTIRPRPGCSAQDLSSHRRRHRHPRTALGTAAHTDRRARPARHASRA